MGLGSFLAVNTYPSAMGWIDRGMAAEGAT